MGKRTTKRVVDKRQDKRLKALETFVSKTIENKQVNFTNSLNVMDPSVAIGEVDLSLLLEQGPGDGGDINIVGAQQARIGNDITLTKQHFKFNLRLPILAPDSFNQCRIILVESEDGEQALELRDFLNFANPAIYSSYQIMNSGYTTKTTTNRRYKILMDKRMAIQQFNQPYKGWSKTIRYKTGKVIHYNDNLSSVPTSWKQQLFYMSDSTVPGHPILDYYYRNTYKDA